MILKGREGMEALRGQQTMTGDGDERGLHYYQGNIRYQQPAAASSRHQDAHPQLVSHQCKGMQYQNSHNYRWQQYW